MTTPETPTRRGSSALPIALAFCAGAAATGASRMLPALLGARIAHAQQPSQLVRGGGAGRYALTVTPAVASASGGIVQGSSVHLLDTSTGQVWLYLVNPDSGPRWVSLGSPTQPKK